MQHILIITDQPIVGIGIDFVLKKQINKAISINIKPFDKNAPIYLIEEMYNALFFCLTTKSADQLATLGKPFKIPTLICANIKKGDSIKKLIEMGSHGVLSLKSEINELVAAIDKLLAYQLYMPEKHTKLYAGHN